MKQKSIIITESGERLYQYAKEILQLTEQISLEINDHTASVKGHLRIGTSQTIGEYILPAFLATFLKKYPDIEVEVCIDNTAIISEQVKALTLDICLIEGSTTSNHFIQEYILEDHLVLATPYNEAMVLNKNGLPTTDYLETQKWIIREDGSGTKEYMDLFLASHEITPKQIMTMGSNYAIIESVRYHLGVTILSHIVAKLPVKQKNSLSFLWKKVFTDIFLMFCQRLFPLLMQRNALSMHSKIILLISLYR